MDWNVILSNVLQAVLLIVLPPLAVALVRWIWAQAELIFQGIKLSNPNVADLLAKAAEFAVKAAEQAGAGHVIDDKKSYALVVAEKWLLEQGITVDLKVIDAAIEEAVGDLFPTEPAAG